MTERGAEAGFSLLELTMCVALLVTIGLGAMGSLPALVRASQSGTLHAAALEIARNTLERTRAAAAYYPPDLVAAAGSRAIATAGHMWAFGAPATFVATARLQRAYCGAASAPADVPMNVTTSYDAPSDAVTVSVDYPPNPCLPAMRAQVTLRAQLAPAAYAPQTQLQTAIDDPALQ